MSVYTTVSGSELTAWLTRYSLGAVKAFEPIAAGIENTNYFLTAERGSYVLTLYERLPPEELPFYLNLMAHLADAGAPVPAPEPDRSGALWSFLNGKPASVVTRLNGVPLQQPKPIHCTAVGESLARMHLAVAGYRPRLSNRRGPGWWRRAAGAVRAFLPPEQNELLASEIKFQAGFAKVKLPRGAIHGDLFCDNVLFEGDSVSGIIDFGFAATDAFAYDLAIAVNDWCTGSTAPSEDGEHETSASDSPVGDDCRATGSEADSKPAPHSVGSLDPDRLVAMIAGYCAVRSPTAEERDMWPVLLRAAALRFWVSRLYDLHLPRAGDLTHAHDPKTFEVILRDRVSSSPEFPRI